MSRRKPEVAELMDAVAAAQTRMMEYRKVMKDLVEACGHVNIGALEGHTVKDFRKVMKFMAACDAAQELLGTD